MKRILVTRPAGRHDAVVAALETAGFDVTAVPTVATELTAIAGSEVSAFDWVVLTSVRGVDALTDLPRGPRYAAVGRQTAAALKARGVVAAHVPPEASGASLAATLPDVAGKHVVLVRASAADPDVPGALRRRGAVVREITGYQTVEAPPSSAAALHAALAGQVDAVVFASGSAARGYVALGGPVDIPAITIGPRTTAAVQQLGFTVAAEAESPSVEALVAAARRAAREEDVDARAR